MNRIRNVLLLSLWLILPSASHALEVFGNGNLADNGTSAGFSFNAHNAWAIPFTPGASTLEQRTLSGAHVLVGGDTVARTFSVSIYLAEAGTNAGPTGSALRSGSMSLGINDTVAWRQVNFSSPLVLASSTNYYLVVEQAVASTQFLWESPSTIPSGNRTYSNLGSGSSYQITGGDPAAVNVYGRIGSAWSSSGSTVATTPLGFQLVPEPSTWAMGVIGALGFAAFGKRSRRRA